MRSLFVRLAHLGDEGQAVLDHPGRDVGVAGGAEVVGVGEERVADPLLQQGVEHAGRDERDVDVAVAGRAPLELGVRRATAPA